MASADDVRADVQAQIAAGDFIARLADRIGVHLQASAVFGDPVEREGVTVIPVAKAAWGLGGGTGDRPDQRGLGGGGGGAVAPLGYIEVRDDGAEFKPIRDSRVTLAAGVAAAGLATLVAQQVLRRRG